MIKNSIFRLIKDFEEMEDRIVRIAEDRNTKSSELQKLSSLENNYIRTCIAMNPSTSSNLLEKWLKLYKGVDSMDEEFRIHILNNKALKLEVLKKAVKKDRSKYVRRVAGNILRRICE